MGYTFAPVNDRNGLIAMCVIFSVLVTAAVTLRFCSRKYKGLQFQADDWLIAASLVSVRPNSEALSNRVLCPDLCPGSERYVPRRWAIHKIHPLGVVQGLTVLGCVQHVITGHSPVVNDFPVSTEKEHIAEKVCCSAMPLFYILW